MLHTQTQRTSPSASVHIGADGSCGGATKTVSPVPSRARGGGRGRGGVGVGGRTALQGGRGHDSSESGGDVTRGNTPAAAAAAGSDSSATTTTTTTTRRTLQAAPVATATSPLCHGRGRWDRLRRGRDGFNECTRWPASVCPQIQWHCTVCPSLQKEDKRATDYLNRGRSHLQV